MVFSSPGSKRTAVVPRDIEAHAEGGGTVEFQGAVDLEEVEVRADLYRTIAGVADLERDRRPAGVDLDGGIGQHVAADRSHRLRLGVWIVRWLRRGGGGNGSGHRAPRY